MDNPISSSPRARAEGKESQKSGKIDAIEGMNCKIWVRAGEGLPTHDVGQSFFQGPNVLKNVSVKQRKSVVPYKLKTTLENCVRILK